MTQQTDDIRIKQVRALVPPADLVRELPITHRASRVVLNARAAIADAIAARDSRLVVVVGPCSIHDPAAALEYAQRLVPLAARYSHNLIIVMRAYFEKPRTSVGWKGLINDPDIDESYHINKGLRLARRLLLDINGIGIPTGSEFLDTQIPQYLADLTSWAAIGARTSESQIHRELASGLSMPVGFKNGTSGNLNVAVEAVVAARSPHWFPSVTKQGIAAISQTLGNDTCHIILRGGTRTGPNYSREHVREACARLAAHGLPESVMIDCSHGNSSKDHRLQATVTASACEQVASGSPHILGVMLESHLREGRQNFESRATAVFGQSITDSCLSIEQTEPLLEQLANAQRARNSGESAGSTSVRNLEYRAVQP
jgi:3-deoxy-7-phosphoheptulonate synthase